MPPLLKNLEKYTEHAFEYMAPSTVELISNELKRMTDKRLATDGMILLRVIECFLQLTRRKLASTQEFRTKLTEFDKVFEGALWSSQFIEIDSSRRLRYCRVWRLIKSIIVCSRPGLASNIHAEPARLKLCERVKAVIDFENLEKCPEALWYWSGWPVINQTGKISYLPLGKLYKSHGYDFSKRFYELYKSIVMNQRAVGIEGVRSLISYLAEHASMYTTQCLQDSKTSKKLLMSFRSDYFTKCYANGEGCKLKTISKAWLYSIVPFIKKLVKVGLLAAPYKGMPTGTPTFNSTHTPNHRVSDDGREENIKLTFPIPLEVSDDEAIELIFGQVQHDLEVVKTWSRNEIDQATSRLNRFTQECSAAELNTEVHSSDEIASLEARCYLTYKRVGFATHNDKRIAELYRCPLKTVAKILPLPNTNTIVPFAYFLVANHSEITPEFLCGCNLFDKHGLLTGLEQTDAGWYLVGYKYRKGAKRAQQKILLNEQTYSAIKTLIALTEPVREYLKKKNDPIFRKLFISTGAGLQTPKSPTSLTVSHPLRGKLAESFKNLGVPDKQAQTLSKHCTLTAIRALGGVAKYIETESLVAASQALGHTHFDYKLLKRYIPKPLITFFSDRWIRVFHQGFILEAMEDSPYALAATDFHTHEQMHEFLAKHALKIRKTSPDCAKSQAPLAQTEVVFCIDELVLTMMLKIAQTQDSDQTTPKDRYWSGVAKSLIAYLESDECSRPDFQEMLDKVKQVKLSEALYE